MEDDVCRCQQNFFMESPASQQGVTADISRQQADVPNPSDAVALQPLKTPGVSKVTCHSAWAHSDPTCTPQERALSMIRNIILWTNQSGKSRIIGLKYIC